MLSRLKKVLLSVCDITDRCPKIKKTAASIIKMITVIMTHTKANSKKSFALSVYFVHAERERVYMEV